MWSVSWPMSGCLDQFYTVMYTVIVLETLRCLYSVRLVIAIIQFGRRSQQIQLVRTSSNTLVTFVAGQPAARWPSGDREDEVLMGDVEETWGQILLNLLATILSIIMPIFGTLIGLCAILALFQCFWEHWQRHRHPNRMSIYAWRHNYEDLRDECKTTNPTSTGVAANQSTHQLPQQSLTAKDNPHQPPPVMYPPNFMPQSTSQHNIMLASSTGQLYAPTATSSCHVSHMSQSIHMPLQHSLYAPQPSSTQYGSLQYSSTPSVYYQARTTNVTGTARTSGTYTQPYPTYCSRLPSPSAIEYRQYQNSMSQVGSPLHAPVLVPATSRHSPLRTASVLSDHRPHNLQVSSPLVRSANYLDTSRWSGYPTQSRSPPPYTAPVILDTRNMNGSLPHHTPWH